MQKRKTPVTIKSDASALAAKRTTSPDKFRESLESAETLLKPVHRNENNMRQIDQKLFTAAWNGDVQKVWDLLDEGADIYARNGFGETVLHTAAHGGHPVVAELLLAKKADINAIDKERNTPLLLACVFKNMEVIKVLLEKGADAGIANKNGYVPKLYLVRLANKNKDLRDILEKGVNLNGIKTRFVAVVTPTPNNGKNSKNGQQIL